MMIPSTRRERQAVLGGVTGLFLVAGLCAAPLGTFGEPPTKSADTEAIRQMIEKYTRSINDADTKLASQIWLDSPDVSFIHPLGHAHGFEQIKKDVYEQLMGGTFSERELMARDIAIHVHGDSAWAEFYWDFNARFRKNGSPVTTHGRETQVYWKTKDGWRLVHVHYSGMPVANQRQGF